jgi:hypothetical protein
VQRITTGYNARNEHRLARVRLNSRRDLPSSNIIEELDVLTQHSLEILFSNALRIDFACVHPDIHIDVCADEDSGT